MSYTDDQLAGATYEDFKVFMDDSTDEEKELLAALGETTDEVLDVHGWQERECAERESDLYAREDQYLTSFGE